VLTLVSKPRGLLDPNHRIWCHRRSFRRSQCSSLFFIFTTDFTTHDNSLRAGSDSTIECVNKRCPPTTGSIEKNTIKRDFGHRVFHDRIMEYKDSLTSIQLNLSDCHQLNRCLELFPLLRLDKWVMASRLCEFRTTFTPLSTDSYSALTYVR
jgi:hypothetical protein